MKKHHILLMLLLACVATIFLKQGRDIRQMESTARDELNMLREAVKRSPEGATAPNLTTRSSRSPAIDTAKFSADLSDILKGGQGEGSRQSLEDFAKKYQVRIASAPLSKLKEICALLEKDFPLDHKDSEMARGIWLFIVGEASKSDPAWAFAKLDEAPIEASLGIFKNWASQNGEPMNPAFAGALLKWLEKAESAGRMEEGNPLVTELRADIAAAQGDQPAAVAQISRLPYLSQRQAAIDYVEGLQTSEARQQAMKEFSTALHIQNFPHFVSKLAEQQGFDAAKEILVSSSLTPEKHDLAAASIAATNIGPDTPAKAQWFMQSLRSEDKRAIVEFTDRWTHADHQGAAQWMNSLPPGKQRDAAIAGFAPAAAKIDGATAVDWALTLTDPNERRSCLDDVIRKWKETDAEAADAYLKEKRAGMDIPRQ